MISALYSNPDAGLYRDIYFPIIKYAIVCLFFSGKVDAYYDLEDVQKFILENFGIKIPLIVLKKTIQKLDNSRDINLVLYENGSKFMIKQAWSVEANAEIDQRTADFDESISVLEQKYDRYKDKEGLEDNRTFLDFITDNCDDILGYFEKNDISQVNQEYTIMAYFLEYLHQTDAELFKVANELFWGSIIAGFLKRENPEMEKRTGSDKLEYYLDTSLVMALLELSTPEKQNYTREMMEIIVSSGCIARVHPITIREVQNIILSVESNGIPRPGTDIASAFERRGLSTAKLANIRVNLVETLDKLKVSEQPKVSDRDIDKIIEQYRAKSVVRQLHERRGSKNVTDDVFRDIHDVYMADFISGRRKQKNDSSFFVTMNSDFITFYREQVGKDDLGLLHPGRIVLEMWMHNSANTDLKGRALTETMARCLVMNNQEIKHKLNVVARYYNESLSDFNPEAYKAIIIGLYKRDKELITSIDQLEDAEANEQNHAAMLRLAESALDKERSRNNRFADIQEQLTSLQKKNEEVLVRLTQVTTEKQFAEDQAVIISDSDRKNKRQVDLYQKKDEIRDTLDEKKKEYQRLEKAREASISLKSYYAKVWLPFSFIVLFGIIGILLYFWNKSLLMEALISGGISLFIFICQLFNANVFNYKTIRNEEIDKQRDIWERNHPEFSETKEEMDSLQEQLKDITKELTQFDRG